MGGIRVWKKSINTKKMKQFNLLCQVSYDMEPSSFECRKQLRYSKLGKKLAKNYIRLLREKTILLRRR